MERKRNGTIVQTLDVFDFSVIHLSAYERLQRKYKKRMSVAQLPMSPSLEPIEQSTSFLKDLVLRRKIRRMERSISHNTSTSSIPNNRESGFQYAKNQTKYLLNKTVAVMPFLGSDMGSGHSNLGNRYKYLHTCFWSVYAYFPHVVIGVKTQVDFDYIRYVECDYCNILCNVDANMIIYFVCLFFLLVVVTQTCPCLKYC